MKKCLLRIDTATAESNRRRFHRDKKAEKLDSEFGLCHQAEPSSVISSKRLEITLFEQDSKILEQLEEHLQLLPKVRGLINSLNIVSYQTKLPEVGRPDHD